LFVDPVNTGSPKRALEQPATATEARTTSPMFRASVRASAGDKDEDVGKRMRAYSGTG
jgi:hypothetical protein